VVSCMNELHAGEKPRRVGHPAARPLLAMILA
jgi:hypothetical protein